MDAGAAEALGPVTPEERIGALDMLRGWALFGVLWSNLDDHYGTQVVTAFDRGLSRVQEWLIESRFYSLLILLFGIGFGIQLTRAQGRGTDLRNVYYRRSAALLLIGVVHGTLIWEGDILTIYALVAFALVMFRTATTRQVLVAALLLWFVGPTIVREAMHVSGLRVMLPGGLGDPTMILGRGTWFQIERVRVDAYLQWLGWWGLPVFVSILASYLMGLWAVKSGYLRRVVSEPRTTRRLLAVSIVASAVGFAMQVWADTVWPSARPPADFGSAFPFPDFQLDMLRRFVLRFFNWATVGLALVYACLLLLVWQRPRGELVLRPLAAAGRMALTTYLTQSIVCTFLFYGYGLGWYGSVSFTGMLLITLILFAGQMLASMWWLKRFCYGPAEWLWRTLAYGRAPVMRVT